MSNANNKAPVGQFITLLIVTGVLIIGAKVYGNNKPMTHTTPMSTAASTNTTPQPNTIAVMQTDKGTITLELFDKDAPITVANFQQLAEKGYYNSVIFHRVIKDFMIQGGDPTGTGTGGASIYGHDFKDEINSHKIVPGTLAMANRGPDTNGSQFFIVTEQNQPSLDGHYTVFGQVINGMDVVKSIAAVPVDVNDKPIQAIKILGVNIEPKNK